MNRSLTIYQTKHWAVTSSSNKCCHITCMNWWTFLILTSRTTQNLLVCRFDHIAKIISMNGAHCRGLMEKSVDLLKSSKLKFNQKIWIKSLHQNQCFVLSTCLCIRQSATKVFVWNRNEFLGITFHAWNDSVDMLLNRFKKKEDKKQKTKNKNCWKKCTVQIKRKLNIKKIHHPKANEIIYICWIQKFGESCICISWQKMRKFQQLLTSSLLQVHKLSK